MTHRVPVWRAATMVIRRISHAGMGAGRKMAGLNEGIK